MIRTSAARLSTGVCPGLATLALLGLPGLVSGQSSSGRPTGRVSLHVTTATRDWTELDRRDRRDDVEISSGVSLESPATDGNGIEYGLNLRHTRYANVGRPDRLSLYDGFAGFRVGGATQARVRIGHMWLQDLGTTGALAGGLVEVGQRQSERAGGRFRAGMFWGLEPGLYGTAYARDVRKYGGYAAYESGFMRRHVVGFTTVKQGKMTERSVLSVTNFVPSGQTFFLYQVAEFDVRGPAEGAAQPGLSYFVTNARVSAGPRVELNGNYNRGRALDARRLTDDLLNGRPLTQQAVDGLQYESAGGRVTVEVARGARFYAGYSRDRTNREDAVTGRTTLGGHAGDLFGTGFDASASDSRVLRASGPYHSRYLSIGRGLGRAVYVSADYSTSLSVVRFLRSDGVTIETRPSTRRYSGSGAITLNWFLSVLSTVDYTMDDQMHELRILVGLSTRIR